MKNSNFKVRNSENMKSLQEINEILRLHKDELKEKYKIKEIGIFGSYVRGEQKKRGSDIDIIVEFEEEDVPGLLKFIEIERYLERLLRKKVDLVRKEAIRPELKDLILKEVAYI